MMERRKKRKEEKRKRERERRGKRKKGKEEEKVRRRKGMMRQRKEEIRGGLPSSSWNSDTCAMCTMVHGVHCTLYNYAIMNEDTHLPSNFKTAAEQT